MTFACYSLLTDDNTHSSDASYVRFISNTLSLWVQGTVNSVPFLSSLVLVLTLSEHILWRLAIQHALTH